MIPLHNAKGAEGGEGVGREGEGEGGTIVLFYARDPIEAIEAPDKPIHHYLTFLYTTLL